MIGWPWLLSPDSNIVCRYSIPRATSCAAFSISSRVGLHLSTYSSLSIELPLSSSCMIISRGLSAYPSSLTKLGWYRSQHTSTSVMKSFVIVSTCSRSASLAASVESSGRSGNFSTFTATSWPRQVAL